MLELERQIAQFTNLNLRPEKHGEKNVPGADLHVHITVGNEMLAHFHPSLCGLLFRPPEPGETDLVDDAEAAAGHTPRPTRLVFGNRLHVIKWDYAIVGADVKVHYGTGGKSDIALDDCTVDGFAIKPMDGGSVQIGMRIKCNPDEKAVGKLANLMGGEIEFSLIPPRDEQQPIAA